MSKKKPAQNSIDSKILDMFAQVITKETISDLLKKKFKKGDGVYTSKIYYIQGNCTQEEIEKIVSKLMSNDILLYF